GQNRPPRNLGDRQSPRYMVADAVRQLGMGLPINSRAIAARPRPSFRKMPEMRFRYDLPVPSSEIKLNGSPPPSSVPKCVAVAVLWIEAHSRNVWGGHHRRRPE